MTQQTAVEWMFEQFFKVKWGSMQGNMPTIFEQAKAMEKKQIEIAFSDGQQIPINSPTLPMYSREEYYNDTYGKE
jgi:hypothetical protein